MKKDLLPYIQMLPKVELHLHIEGSLEPELMFELADRNKIKIPYNSIDAVRQAYNFTNLQTFLDIYYQACNVLQTERDFYDLTWAYLTKAAQQKVKHVELFFDPQTHTSRNIPFDVVIEGMHAALQDAEKQLDISSDLIFCILRHLPEADAFPILSDALRHQDKLLGIGLDSSEKDHPPEKFKSLFEKASEKGFITFAHAGEEGPADYIWQAIQSLKVSRVDHGVRCLEDENLIKHLIQSRIPLTVCPLSNVKLCVFDRLENHPLKTMLEKNLCVTINSDDPAYFGGYIQENYIDCYKALDLSQAQLHQLAANAIHASFASPPRKKKLLAELAACL